ncbi:MAG: LPP20 family lipoprotein [Gammaproteobacteria bacterium]|nr:LPP20 family lipoprotein [Gammaproteobacteria bacterium]
MKARNSLFIVGGVALSVLLTACGSEEVKSVALECSFPDSPTTAAPGWVCDEPVHGIEVYAVGSAEKTAAGVAFAKNMAATDARVQMAQAMKVHVTNMVKQYAETTGAASSETVDKVNTSVTKQITDQMLTGSKIFRNIVSPNGVMYVLVGMDSNMAAKATEEAVRTSMNNDKALWQQFKAQKGQDELAAAIAAGRQ